MAGIDLSYSFSGKIGSLMVEGGDVSYYDISTNLVCVPTRLTHVVAGLVFNDNSDMQATKGHANSRCMEAYDGILCFSISDNTITETVTYIAFGW